MQIIPSFLVDKASCTRQFESEFSLHSLASLFPIKEGIFSNPSVSLSKGSSTSNQAFLLRRKDVTALLGARNRYALRLADHQRSTPWLCGMGPPGMMIHIDINTKLQHIIYYQVLYMPNFPNRHNASNKLYHPHYSICDF